MAATKCTSCTNDRYLEDFTCVTSCSSSRYKYDSGSFKVCLDICPNAGGIYYE